MAKARSQPGNGRNPRTIAAVRLHPIEAARVLKGVDMKTLAEGSGISRPNLYHYARGEYPVTESVIQRLAKYTGYPRAFFKRDEVVLRATYR